MKLRPREWLEEYRRRAEAGDPDAQISLAWEYILGKHVEEDFSKAVALLRAAERRSPRLARFYLAKAKILRADFTFVKDLEEDCQAGFGPALYLMGAAAERGVVGEPNEADALEYFLLAARNGHLVSEFFSSRMRSRSFMQGMATFPHRVHLFFRIFLIKLRNPRDVRILS